jgi:transcriptional regulator with XRE-family HTH domain
VTADETWPARLTRSIAAEIRQRRKEREWSAQRLSDECATLGVAIPRTTLSDLENGRRAYITAAELLVIAAALEINPADLLPDIAPAAWTDPALQLPDPRFVAIRRKVAELSRLLETERTTP